MAADDPIIRDGELPNAKPLTTSDRIWLRVSGALWLLLAARCQQGAQKYPTWSFERNACGIGALLCVYCMYRAWRKEMTP